MIESVKGFLGPIGDDVPSLIPLIFALLLFFASFSFALNEFGKQNDFFESTVEASKITTELRAASYISSWSSFDNVCQGLNLKQLKYRAGLMELKSGAEEMREVFAGIDVEHPDFYRDPETRNYFKCSNVPDGDSTGAERYIVAYYPVGLETSKTWSVTNPEESRNLYSKFAVKPMLLVIVVWRR